MKQGVVYDRRWRSGYSAYWLFNVGSWFILIGSALMVAANGNAGWQTGCRGCYTAGDVLYIIAFVLWTLASLVQIGTTAAMVAGLALTKTPFIARAMTFASWGSALGSLLLLIGACLFMGSGTGSGKAGGILFLIGSSLMTMAALTYLSINLMAAVSTQMAVQDVVVRQGAWAGLISSLWWLLGLGFFTLGSMLWAILTGPGIATLASLEWLVASCVWVVGHAIALRGAAATFTSPLAFAVTTLGLSTAAVGVGAGAVAGAGLAGAAVGTGMAGKPVGERYTDNAGPASQMAIAEEPQALRPATATGVPATTATGPTAVPSATAMTGTMPVRSPVVAV